MDFYIGQNDELPEYTMTLDTNPVTEFSLAGATITFVYRNQHTGERYTVPVTILDAATRLVKLTFTSGAAAVPGDYVGSVVVVFSDLKQMTFPNDRELDFRVRAAL